MTTDRELLELAAKAARYSVAFDDSVSAAFDGDIYYRRLPRDSMIERLTASPMPIPRS
jgi:hypothetical protein